jgi:MFS family permease
MFFLVYAVAVLVSRLFVGRIHDRQGDNAIIYPALAVFAAGLGLLALEPAVWSIAAAGVLSGLGFGSLTPSVQAIAVTEAPEMRLGTATSTFYLMLDLGVGVGPVVLGALLPLTGYPGMFGALCVPGACRRHTLLRCPRPQTPSAARCLKPTWRLHWVRAKAAGRSMPPRSGRRCPAGRVA